MLKIAIISDWFAEKMGYAENCLPKALAALGLEVHLITSTGQPYFNTPMYKATYEPFIGPGVVAEGSRPFDGYMLHRLPFETRRNQLAIKGLRKKLLQLKPDVIQTFDIISISTDDAARSSKTLGAGLFLETHIHASVFPAAASAADWKTRLKWKWFARTRGAALNRACVKCYPISHDSAEIAEFFGIERQKMVITSLGVDTAMFHPPSHQDLRLRQEVRTRLGFNEQEIVAIYTGRFAKDKGPQVLADAIALLQGRGMSFRGLFAGNGTPADVAYIEKSTGCVVHAFVPTRDLPPLYWAADIGVWPMQESTSMLDAAACGLPIVISDKVTVRERAEGNGLFYREPDAEDLAEQLLRLADPALRADMGQKGAEKIRQTFSWDLIARERARDYETALKERT